MKLFCQKCNKEQKLRVLKNGPHTEARCSVCNAHIKFLSPLEKRRWLATAETFNDAVAELNVK